MFRRTQNPLQTSESTFAAKARRLLKSSLAMVALIVLAISTVMVWGNLEGTDDDSQTKAQSVEQVGKLKRDEQPEVKQAEFDQRFDLQQKEAAKPEGLKIDRGPETQAKRKVLLHRLTNKGVFIKAELPGSLPWVWVGPAFHTLDFETKQEMVSIVYSYYLDGSDPIATVRIFDGQTNKEIGDYTPHGTGLRLF
jgi:hypothetical protein